MDWKNLIAELKTHDLTEEQIAAECGCVQSTINALGNGVAKSTKYEIGTALEALLKKVRRRKKSASAQSSGG
jgi:hypothetical protein